eukprot:1160152-Pelagomonas_calceolata.AAC.5
MVNAYTHSTHSMRCDSRLIRLKNKSTMSSTKRASAHIIHAHMGVSAHKPAHTLCLLQDLFAMLLHIHTYVHPPACVCKDSHPPPVGSLPAHIYQRAPSCDEVLRGGSGCATTAAAAAAAATPFCTRASFVGSALAGDVRSNDIAALPGHSAAAPNAAAAAAAAVLALMPMGGLLGSKLCSRQHRQQTSGRPQRHHHHMRGGGVQGARTCRQQHMQEVHHTRLCICCQTC